VATPVGTDYGNATSRSVSIRLVPPGVILPPNGTPVPSFTFSPSSPLTRADVTFDGSLSTDSDGRIVTYAWNFGDGGQASGPVVKHAFNAAGSYTVTLTVTDDRGQSASLSKAVPVSLTGAPKADFVVSPSSPAVNEKVFFNAAPSTAADGRTIVRYDWDYGQGRQDSGLLVWHIYPQPGSYTVMLTVTDDAGNKGSTSKTVAVGAGGASASFSYLPTAPAGTAIVYFDGAASRGTGGITTYAWDFGDGTFGSGVSPSHQFCTATGLVDRTFTVALTVTDSTGATSSTAKSVKVTGCS
jgi:PKD repeat protein